MLRANPFVLPNEELDRLADRYLSIPPRLRRFLEFGEFLQRPRLRDDLALAILVALRRNVDQLDREQLGYLGAQSSRDIEKLRHHRFPRRAHRDFIPQRQE